MQCPRCGDEMNHHADKVCDPVEPSDASEFDPELGGVVYETHACPGCGYTHLRTAARHESTSKANV